ncbi:MAG: Crp/Fnr family transcriptional regulator [Deltaproteobacteria bacterium]|jgi:CRP/FNR family transcriptional regulator|nr:Crp/Fnr family transcriptional regulator [Deltaproteobacteria bacterium]
MVLIQKFKAEEIIGQSFFFSGLPLNTSEKLAGITEAKKWPKKAVIFSRGQEAAGFYLLASGQVRIYLSEPNGQERVIKIVRPGEVFGEAAIFQTEGYPANAEALKPSSALFWPKRELINLLQKDGDLAVAIIGILAQKLGHFASLMRSSLKEVVPKVAEYLLELEAELKPELWPKRYLMALALGVSAESLSRALTKLKNADLITQSPELKIIDRPGLKAVALGQPLKHD